MCERNTNSNIKNITFLVDELSLSLENAKADNIQKLVTAIKEKCMDKDPRVSTTALHALTTLVRRRQMPVSQGLSTLVSLVVSNKVPAGLVPAICRLLLIDAARTDWEDPYSTKDRQHPLLIILKQDSDAWSAVEAYIYSALTDSSLCISSEKRLALIHPIVTSLILEPKTLLLHKSCSLRILFDAKYYKELVELLAWQQIDLNWCYLLREIVFKATKTEGAENVVEALTLAVAAGIHWLVNSGHDPTHWLNLLLECLKTSNFLSSAVLYILAEILPECPSVYLLDIATTCFSIIESSSCCKVIAGRIGASLLSWVVTPSLLTAGLHTVTLKILKIIPTLENSSSNQHPTNPLNRFIINSHPIIRAAVETINLISQWDDEKAWLRKLELTNHVQTYRPHFLTLAGIGLIAEDATVVFRMIFKILEEDSNLSFAAACLMLYKCSRELEPKLQLTYLKMLPQLVRYKVNIPIILGSINALERGNHRVMAPLRLILLLEMWKVEKRTFPYLHRVLQEPVPSGEAGWEFQVARASAILSICTIAPNLHGKDMIGRLSDILNCCGDDLGEAPSAIALDAITELCKSHIVDIKGTWNALEPKLGVDRRPIVVESICRLLGQVPYLHGDIFSAIARLWTYVNNGLAAKEALAALGNFGHEDFTLRSFPEPYWRGLQFPKQLLMAATEADKPPEELITYLPGECWVFLLLRMNKNLLPDTMNMVGCLVKQEVARFPRGIYHLPSAAPEPKTYSHLPPNSIVGALTTALQKMLSESEKDYKSCGDLLNVLSRDYNRPLPVMDWSFLASALTVPSCKRHVVSLSCQQGANSPSAQKLVRSYISEFDYSDKEETLFALSVLPGLCSCAPPTELQLFLKLILETSLDEALGSAANSEVFTSAMAAVRATVCLANVPEAARTAVIAAFEILLHRIPYDCNIMKSYAEALADMPEKVVDRMTSPTLWWEVTSANVRRTVQLRAAIALHSATANPLSSFIQIIDTAAGSPQDYSYVLQVVLETAGEVRTHSSCCSWLQNLAGRTVAAVNASEKQLAMFILDVFMASAIVLSGTDHFAKDFASLASSSDVRLSLFPSAIKNLVEIQNPSWGSVAGSIIQGVHRLFKWKLLPEDFKASFSETIQLLRLHQHSPPPQLWHISLVNNSL